MSVSRTRYLNRSMVPSRSRQPYTRFHIDTSKSDLANALDILRQLTSVALTDESLRLSLLNCLAKLLSRNRSDDDDSNDSDDYVRGAEGRGDDDGADDDDDDTMLGDHYTSTGSQSNPPGHNIYLMMPGRDYLYLLSASLVQPLTQIRAATLRVLRHLLRSVQDVRAFNDLQLPHLLSKSLDVLLDNEEERVQAMKLIRKMLAIAPRAILTPIVRSLVALGDSVSDDGDRMLRACLAILCEFGVLHPRALIMCGGVSAITRNVLECHSPRIAESLVGVLLHLLEQPQTRRLAGVRLDCLAAPYCDFTYRLGLMDKNKDARDLRFTSSRLALLTVLRSWAGTLEFCDPTRASGLRAIVDVLYLNQLEVRKAILDLLYELLWLPQPVWTDEYSVALAVIDPADLQDSWRLGEGFVAAEGRSVLPTLATRVPNICEIHTALLLYCFLETGLLNALVEVVVSGDTFISVRATVLIGKLLQLMHQLLPADILSAGSALPTLVEHAAAGNPQARSAIGALQSLHTMLRNRPAAASMFLETIIGLGAVAKTRAFRRELDPHGWGEPDASGPSAAPDAAGDGDQQQVAGATVAASGASTPAATTAAAAAAAASRPGSVTPDAANQPQKPPPPVEYQEHVRIPSHIVNDSSSSTLKRRTRLDSTGSSGGTGDDKDTAGSGGSRGSRTLSSLRRVVGNRRVRALFAQHQRSTDIWMRESFVLHTDDENQWDWEIILTFLRTEAPDRLDDQHIRFIRRLVGFFKPSSNRFSHQDLGHSRSTPVTVHSGLELLDWLLQSSTLDGIRLITDLCSDISSQLRMIVTARSAHECLFSPQHMANTMCQQYFLFIGRMSRSSKGVSILNNTNIFERLSDIVKNTQHVCYVKLIISCLDYTWTSRPREVLEAAFWAVDRRAAQLYATQFMMVLLRARLPQFENWGLQLLVRQMCEGSKVVAQAAHEVLEEALHVRRYLEVLIEMWPDWERVGEMGAVTRTRFYSVPSGLAHPRAKVLREVEKWRGGYNKSYVLLCEADTHSVLTLHTKNEEGAYSRRSCSSRPTITPPNLLPHLYGQLVQTPLGCELLQQHGDIPQLCEQLRQLAASVGDASDASNDFQLDADHVQCARIEQHSLELKAAIWALCHTATSRLGWQLVAAHDPQFAALCIELCKHCPVYSVRATALHALSLLGSTAHGADALYAAGWLCVRHDRDTAWPACESDDQRQQTTAAGYQSGLAGWQAWMRNALGPVPPYNYAGLDEVAEQQQQQQLSSEEFGGGGVEYRYAGGDDGKDERGEQEVVALRAPAAGDDAVDSPLVPAAAATGASQRSGTLPAGSVNPHRPNPLVYKHSRSASESKTVQLAAAAAAASAGESLPHFQHPLARQRFNSGGTDSNTSGVSSCESVYGAAAARFALIADLQHANTLSPIPSTSNLMLASSLASSVGGGGGGGRPAPAVAAGSLGSAGGGGVAGAGGASDRIRRISLTGASFSPFTTLSPQDAQGYAALRKLRSGQRPQFSESAADDLADLLDVSAAVAACPLVATSGSLGGGGSGAATAAASARSLKVRSLDRQSGIGIGMLQGIAALNGVSSHRTRTESCDSTTTALHLAYLNDQSGPVYSGICLPRNILDLFHGTGPAASISYVTQVANSDDPDPDALRTTATAGPQKSTSPRTPPISVPHFHLPKAAATAATLHPQHQHVPLSQSFSIVDGFGCDDTEMPAVRQPTSSMSSLSDISSATSAASRRSKWLSKHNRQQCFHCCRLAAYNAAANSATLGGPQSMAAPASATTTLAAAAKQRRLSAPLSPPQRSQLNLYAAPTSAATGPNTATMSSGHGSTSTGAGTTTTSNTTASTTASASSEPTASGASSEFSDAADRISEAILRHVQRMANPVWSKQSKMALLEMKQKHPAAYQDCCLYAEVCKALAVSTYRLAARRFLQELFLDLRFEGFGRGAAETFARCEPELVRRVEREQEARLALREQQKTEQRQQTRHQLTERRSGRREKEAASAQETLSAVKATAAAAAANVASQLAAASGGGSGGEHVYAMVKMLRHSQLPSVTEASVENLAESVVGSAATQRPRILLPSGKSPVTDIDKPPSPPIHKPFKLTQPANPHRPSSSHTPTASALAATDCTDGPAPVAPQSRLHRSHSHSQHQHQPTESSTTDGQSQSNQSQNQNHLATMRPRFNTLELDLSCTKNKFPITARRQQIQQQLQQTSAPATPSEWSVQHSRAAAAVAATTGSDKNVSSGLTTAPTATATASVGEPKSAGAAVAAAAATSVSVSSVSSSSAASSNGSVLLVATLHAAKADEQAAEQRQSTQSSGQLQQSSQQQQQQRPAQRKVA